MRSAVKVWVLKDVMEKNLLTLVGKGK